MDLLWFVLAVGVILIGGLLIGLVMVWLFGKISERRGGRDDDAGVTPGPPPQAPGDGADPGSASPGDRDGGDDGEH